MILSDLKHDLIPAPRETTPVVRILTQGSQIGKLFQSIYQINPIVILTRGSQIGQLFRSIYQIDPIVILTQGFPNWKIISTNLSNKSNCNSHSGIPNWKIISTNLSNKSNSNYFVQIRKVIKIASRHHETAFSNSNVRSKGCEKLKIEISRQPEIVSAKNRAGMRRRGSLF